MQDLPPYVQTLLQSALHAYDADQWEPALQLLKIALTNDAGNHEALYLLGHLQFTLKQFPEAEKALRQSLLIDPAQARAQNDLGATLFAMGRDAEALTHIRQALMLDPNLPEAEESDGIWLLRYGRFREAWRKYEARYRTHVSGPHQRKFTQPQWAGEPIDGRTILLHAEQGFGDTIQFVRYVPLVADRGAKVVLEVQQGIGTLLTGVKGPHHLLERGRPLPDFDVHCPLLSLPMVFDTDLDSIPAPIPYLAATEQRIFEWRARLGRPLGPRRAMRIGIAWSGNPAHRDDYRRSIPLAQFAQLLTDRPDCEFHVLQAIVRDSDKEALRNLPHVHDHSLALADFTHTAALISLMDVVISVDTSVAHLAGAMGWPVWLLVASQADWRWLLERDDSPWYPTFWLFRQRHRGDWDGVLTRVAQELDDMLT